MDGSFRRTELRVAFIEFGARFVQRIGYQVLHVSAVELSAIEFCDRIFSDGRLT